MCLWKIFSASHETWLPECFSLPGRILTASDGSGLPSVHVIHLPRITATSLFHPLKFPIINARLTTLSTRSNQLDKYIHRWSFTPPAGATFVLVPRLRATCTLCDVSCALCRDFRLVSSSGFITAEGYRVELTCLNLSATFTLLSYHSLPKR